MNNARIQPPASPAAQRAWGARLARLWTYFSEYRLGWALAILANLAADFLYAVLDPRIRVNA